MFWEPIVGRIRGLRPASEGARVRIALVSTPRSGNTWLRHMIDHAYRFSDQLHGELALYNPFEAPWADLPEQCVIMTHWHRVQELESLYRQHGFVIVTLARHPLDVLLSVLQYSPCEGSLRWLEGQDGDERPIFHKAPLSEEFGQYATGPRAQALLAVSSQWWNAERCHRIRYEDLVRNPRRELARLTRRLGVEPPVSIDEAVEACTFERLKNPVTARHFWQGKPGIWKSLLPRDEARRIARTHAKVFATLGYRCDPDARLDAQSAMANWSSLAAGKRKSAEANESDVGESRDNPGRSTAAA